MKIRNVKMAAPGSEEHLYRHETEAHTKARKKKKCVQKISVD